MVARFDGHAQAGRVARQIEHDDVVRVPLLHERKPIVRCDDDALGLMAREADERASLDVRARVDDEHVLAARVATRPNAPSCVKAIAIGPETMSAKAPLMPGTSCALVVSVRSTAPSWIAVIAANAVDSKSRSGCGVSMPSS